MLCSHHPFAEKTITSSCTTETGSRMEQKKPLSRSLTKLVSIPNTETDGARARTGSTKLELLIFDVLNFDITIARHIGNFFNIFPEVSVFVFTGGDSFTVSRCLPQSPEFSYKTRFARKSLNKTFMVYILAASSVHHPIDAFSPEQQSQCKDKVYAIPSLCLNPYAKNPRKNCAKFDLARSKR